MATRTKKGCYSMAAVVRFHDGEMAARDATAFREHVLGCEECRTKLRAAEAALGAFEQYLASEPPPLDIAEALRHLRRGEREARMERLGWKVIKGSKKP